MEATKSPKGYGSTMFFISLDGDECTLTDSLPPLSTSLLKIPRLEKRLRRNSQNIRLQLYSRMASAEGKRSEMRKKMMRERETKERRRKAIMERRKKEEKKEIKMVWAKMKRRDFVVQFRKERLRNVPRSKLLTAELVGSPLLNEMTLLVQNAWLSWRIGPFVRGFLKTGILGTEEYEKMKELMMSKTVIQTAANLLMQLVKCDPIAQSLTNPSRAGRILLTALLLDQYGTEVMSNASEEETIVLEHAGVFSESLRAFLAYPTRYQMLDVAEQWTIFRDSFSLWQGQDRVILVRDMQQDYITLQEILVKLGPEARAEWLPHVKKHQDRLVNALKRIAGPASVEQLEEKLQGMKLETIKDDEELVFENTKLDKVAHELMIDPLFDHRKSIKLETEKPDSANIEISVIGDSHELERVRIAHEMMVDPSFDHCKLMRLKTGKSDSADFEIPNIDHHDLSSFLNFVLLIKKQLLDMVQGTKSRLAEQLSESLPEEFLNEQLMNHSLEPYKILEFLGETMSGMCAPMRDTQLRQLLDRIKGGNEGITNLCREMGAALMLMHEDLSNFNLNMLKPRLAKTIVDYERDWFAIHVLNQTFPNTHELVNLVNEGTAALYQDKKPLERLHAVIAEVFLAVVGYEHDNLKKVSLPDVGSCELLVLDQQRLLRLKQSFSNFITQSALVLTLRTLGHPNPEQSVLRCRELDLRIDSIKAELCRDANDLCSSIHGAVDRIFCGTDPIVTLLSRRVGSMLRQSMLEESISAKPISSMLRNGFAEGLCPDYNAAAEELIRAYLLHRQVLGPIYHKIYKD